MRRRRLTTRGARCLAIAASFTLLTAACGSDGDADPGNGAVDDSVAPTDIAGNDSSGDDTTVPGDDSSGDDTTVPGDDNTLVVAMAETASTLDPKVYQVTSNWVHMSGAMGSLIEHEYQDFPDPAIYDGDVPVFDADSFKPGLAESWEFSEDGTKLRMVLREAESPFGNTLTADDVLFTVERSLAIPTLGAFGMTLAQVDRENPLTVVDDMTIEWNLLGPAPLVEKIMAWWILSPLDSTEVKKHVTADDPWAEDWLDRNTAYFGPYHATEFTAGTEVTLELNPNYWGEKPDIARIVMRSVPDPGNRQQLLETGEVHFVPDLPRNQLAALEGSEAVEVVYPPATRFAYIQFNTAIEPLNDPLVRQAIAFAIPYEQILEDAWLDSALSVRSPATWLPLSDPIAYQYETDLEAARQLLTEAGFPDGFSTELYYSVVNPGPENEQAAIIIQAALAEIGIDVQLFAPSSESTFQSESYEGRYPLSLLGMAPFAPDAGYALLNLASTDGAQNRGSNYSSAEFDEVIGGSMETVDPDERGRLISEASAIFAEDAVYMLLSNPLLGVAHAPNVSGYRTTPTAFPFWKYFTMGK